MCLVAWRVAVVWGVIGACGMGVVGEEPARRGDPEGEFRARVSKALEQKLDWDFKARPLGAVATWLAEKTGIPVQLQRRKLDEAGVTRETPLTLQLRQVTVRTGLRLLLGQVELAWYAGAGSIVITSPEEAEKHELVRVYAVGELVQTAGAPACEPPDFDTLIDLITTSVAPQSWDTGNSQALYEFGHDCVVLRQTREVHEQVEELLALWRRVRADQAENPLQPQRAWYGSPRLEEALRKLSAKDSREIDMPLTELVREWSKVSGLPVWIDRRKLDEVGVDPAMARVGSAYHDVPLLEGMQHALDDLQLGLQVLEDAVIVTTVEAAESQLALRFYPVYDLIPPPDAGRRTRQKVSDELRHLEDLMERLGGPGSATAIANPPALVVSGTLASQREVEHLLAGIRSQHRPVAAAVVDPNQRERRVLTLRARPGETKPPDAQEIARLIRKYVAVGSWEGKAADLDVFENRLIVTHQARALGEVEDFLRAIQVDYVAGGAR